MRRFLFFGRVLSTMVAALLGSCTIFNDAGVHAQIMNNAATKIEITYVAKGPFNNGQPKLLSLSPGETITLDLISEFGPDPRNPFPSDFTLMAGTHRREIRRIGGRWGPATEGPFSPYAYGSGYRYQIEPDLKIYMLPPDCETPCRRLFPQPPDYPL